MRNVLLNKVDHKVQIEFDMKYSSSYIGFAREISEKYKICYL